MKKRGRTPEINTGTSQRHRDTDEEKRRLRRRAIEAYLIGKQGHDQCELVDLLADSYGINVCAATVTRDLQWLRDKRWLVTHIGDDCPGMEHLEAVKQTAHFYGGLQEALRQRSGGTLKSFHVFWSGPPKRNGGDSWDDRLSRFAERAAPTLREILAGGRRIGVSFAATIGVCIEALASSAHEHTGQPRDLIVVPTSGEPLGGAKATLASTDLAERLSEILGGSDVPSLRGIPPIIPEKFAGQIHASGLGFLRCYRSYKKIFGDCDTKGLVDELDTVLTSAGGFGEHYHAFQNEVVENPKFTRERVGEVAEGDICGGLVRKNGHLTKAQEKTLEALRDLWTGIRLEHLERISANARDNGHPGVILCALGASKADIALTVTCRDKLVNHLLIDETLATRLQELLDLPTVPA